MEDLTYFATNLTEDITPIWSDTAGYALDTIRQLDTKLYQALDTIDPLAQYIYDNTDPLNAHYTTDILTDTEQVNTAVVCELNVTIVYMKDQNLYYKFDNSTGTVDVGGGFFEVDFTTQDPATPTNFTADSPYRHDIYNPKETPLKWADLGYTNKYKCLDQSLSSQTESDTDITMSFVLDKVDEIYLLNLIGISVQIIATQIDTSEILYDETFQLIEKDGATWYDYFYTDYSLVNRVYKDMPINFNVRFDITIVATDDGAKIGLVGLGRSNYMGDTLFGSGISMIDFSKKQVNTLGETYLEKGNYKRTNNLIVDIPYGLTDTVINKLIDFRATPVIFSSKGFSNFIVFGTYNKWNTLIKTPTMNRITIDIESLV